MRDGRARWYGRGFFAAAIGILFCLWVTNAGLAESLTVATYNVENYGSSDRMTEAGFRKDYPKPESEKAALRRVIRRMNVDVLMVQEMGARSHLDELQRDLSHDGLDYPHVALLSGPDADRHVAVLSKRAFTSVKSHVALEFSYFGAKEKVKRGMLEIGIATSAGELTLFGVHLKSRFTDRPDDPRSMLRREGEAVAVRDAVLTRFPEPGSARFMILGDFNDDKSSKTMERLAHRGAVRLTDLLMVADSHGESWTHFYKKEDSFSRVDHVLVSPGLQSAIVDHKGVIEDGPGVREASDHRPVRVTLEFSTKNKAGLATGLIK
ncbi:MAG: endonuclease/exonuclease/phosphatase family protein [Opitutus sp.]